jgi:uncharacterized membrane protein YfcA
MIVIGSFILGIVAGILSGIFGIGGGVIMIPALVYLFGLSQHSAQGTTLAVLVFPIGFFAAYKYFINGYVELKFVPWMCFGFLIGGFIGASIAMPIYDQLLKKLFGIILLIISLRMIFIN